MGLVSPSQSNAGDLITAAAINSPVNQLAAVVNGNIDATNILDNSVTKLKLANASVTNEKIDWSGIVFYNNAASGLSASDGGTTPHSTDQSFINITLTKSTRLFIESATQMQQSLAGVADQFCRIGSSTALMYGNSAKVRFGGADEGGMLFCAADVTLAAGTYKLETYTWTSNASVGFRTQRDAGYIKVTVMG